MTQPQRQDDAQPKLMRLSQAASQAGVGTQTLEYYIMLGLVRPIRRNGSRSRQFDEALVARIRLINRMNKSGYTLAAIREVYLSNR